MKPSPIKSGNDIVSIVPKEIPKEITQIDQERFLKVVATNLDQHQVTAVTSPGTVYPRQSSVLAVHWHPEFVPMDLIEKRINTLYPNKRNTLIIPTQHNEITCFQDYSGVEVDCYSKGFNQKVQLLLHFKNDHLTKADKLKEMLAHTFKYRSSQLFEFIDTIALPKEDRLERAARKTGADASLIRFVRTYVLKIDKLLDQYAGSLSPQALKNKVLRNFFDTLRPDYGDPFINRAQTFLNEVKTIVKQQFSLQYFFRTSEIIEEARSLNAGIVIPHPEQFWPVILANYDVDGIEVWNPQSMRYTEFLISVVKEMNLKADPGKKPLLVFMGDDTHMAEKTLSANAQDPKKTAREIGYQPAWDDLDIQKTLVKAGISREKTISEYRDRLNG